MKILNIFFSPKGTTEKIATQISKGISPEIEEINLLKNPLTQDVKVKKCASIIVSMPVYVGRVPEICVEQLKHLKGDGTLAVIVAVYGNRAYEDALVEMQDILTANGFVIVAAGAFIAEHSIFTQVAQGRPNKEDELIISDFSVKCKAIIQESAEKQIEVLKVNGNRPYRDISKIPLKPSGNNHCTKCGSCKSICPTQAIGDDPRKTDKEKCISCGACIKVCPKNSRSYRGILYKVASKGFVEKCSEMRQPEVFYID